MKCIYRLLLLLVVIFITYLIYFLFMIYTNESFKNNNTQSLSFNNLQLTTQFNTSNFNNLTLIDSIDNYKNNIF